MTLNMLSFSASYFSLFHLPLFILVLTWSYLILLFILLMEGSPQLSSEIDTKISNDMENGEPSTVALLLIIWLMFL